MFIFGKLIYIKVNTPLVTISIPIYKCEAFLEKCLTSVLVQTYKNIEVILVNDKTPDNAVYIAEEFIKKNNLQSTWKIYHLEENSGLSIVRNKGIDTANGKYLFFLDSDDTITENCIDLMVREAEKNNLEMVVGNTVMINSEDLSESDFFRVAPTQKNISNNIDVLEAFTTGVYSTSSWNKLILLDFIKSNKLYFTKGLFAQDELQSFHSALVLNKIGFIDHEETTLYYYLHSNSVIHNRGKRHFDNWNTIGGYIDKALKEETVKNRQNMILTYLINFKSITLIMNWKAQQNEELWKEQYSNYRKLSSLSWSDYFSSNFSKETKKKDFWTRFPSSLGMYFFKKRYNR